MGWRELQGWLEELGRSRKRSRRQQQTDTDSWQGQQHDSWWAEQRAKADRMRGR